ncbi:MAG TPA: POTRA domain-containing protein [Bryobacteraceae bacterium]|jgi:outer membrane protein insertion porin family|nr:POTRA domain-containing protein [Bryobacteraceae bacterium]
MRPGIPLGILSAAAALTAWAQNPPSSPRPSAEFNRQVIAAVEFRGARRVPVDTLRALIHARKGDVYDVHNLYLDLIALWNTGRFEDVGIETQPAGTGVIVCFVVSERRIVRSVRYEGLHSVTMEEVLDRFKERHVGLAVETLYDSNKVQRAAAAIKEYLAERGHPLATVATGAREIPLHSMEVVFHVGEDPRLNRSQFPILAPFRDAPACLRRTVAIC